VIRGHQASRDFRGRQNCSPPRAIIARLEVTLQTKVTSNCKLQKKMGEQDALVAPPLIMLGSNCSPCSPCSYAYGWGAYSVLPDSVAGFQGAALGEGRVGRKGVVKEERSKGTEGRDRGREE